MRSFGIDISDSIMRLAVLRQQRSKYVLPIRGEIALPANLIVDGEIKNIEQVARLLSDLVTAAKPRTNRAFVSLPERHGFIKVLELPPTAEVTDQTIRQAAEQHVPYGWNEIYYDWCWLPGLTPSNNRQLLFGAAPRLIVDEYTAMLERVGIDPLGLEIESLAIARALINPADRQTTCIILDLGRTRTSVVLVDRGTVFFSTTIRYAGKEVNQYIADELHISLEQADKAKKLFGLDPNLGKGFVRQVLSPVLDVLAEKIREISDFYEEHYIDHQPISRILLNGSGSLVKSIDTELAKRLSMPVVITPAYVAGLLAATDYGALSEIGYTYTTALGLAMLGLDR